MDHMELLCSGSAMDMCLVCMPWKGPASGSPGRTSCSKENLGECVPLGPNGLWVPCPSLVDIGLVWAELLTDQGFSCADGR